MCLARDPRDVSFHLNPASSSEYELDFQRPTARELLKHKFVKLAKKTNYLTELIERHERWKAEGGGKHDDDDKRVSGEE
jgi:hypothetical protein